MCSGRIWRFLLAFSHWTQSTLYQSCKYTEDHGKKIFASSQIVLGRAKDCMQQVNTLQPFHPGLQSSLSGKHLMGCQTRNKFPLLFWSSDSCLGIVLLPSRFSTLAVVNQHSPSCSCSCTAGGTGGHWWWPLCCCGDTLCFHGSWATEILWGAQEVEG